MIIKPNTCVVRRGAAVQNGNRPLQPYTTQTGSRPPLNKRSAAVYYQDNRCPWVGQKSRHKESAESGARDEMKGGNKNMGHWHRRAEWRGAGREGEVFGSQMMWTRRRRPPLGRPSVDPGSESSCRSLSNRST